MKIGPSMQAAIDYVRENPGCSIREVSNALDAKGNNWQVIDRCIRAGLLYKQEIRLGDRIVAHGLHVRE